MPYRATQLTVVRRRRYTLYLIRHWYRAGLEQLFVQFVLLQILELGFQLKVVDRFAEIVVRDGIDNLLAECVLLGQFIPIQESRLVAAHGHYETDTWTIYAHCCVDLLGRKLSVYLLHGRAGLLHRQQRLPVDVG